eukprot:6901673-Ditylum_brightwellii.AAC.1
MPYISTGHNIVARLKFVLAPWGQLVQFCAYSNIGLGLIPQQKWSDLQLLGRYIVLHYWGYELCTLMVKLKEDYCGFQGYNADDVS